MLQVLGKLFASVWLSSISFPSNINNTSFSDKDSQIFCLRVDVFSEALIRVKLPQNGIFECKVSPMETLQVLVDIFREVPIKICSA